MTGSLVFSKKQVKLTRHHWPGTKLAEFTGLQRHYAEEFLSLQT